MGCVIDASGMREVYGFDSFFPGCICCLCTNVSRRDVQGLNFFSTSTSAVDVGTFGGMISSLYDGRHWISWKYEETITSAVDLLF